MHLLHGVAEAVWHILHGVAEAVSHILHGVAEAVWHILMSSGGCTATQPCFLFRTLYQSEDPNTTERELMGINDC